MYCPGHLKGLSAHVTTSVFVLVCGFVPCCISNYIILTVFMFFICISVCVYDMHSFSVVLQPIIPQAEKHAHICPLLKSNQI